uniref:serine/arginine repetitive matrix protein 1-like n=1 Tax=Myxine glutinosa TaxID=7769 RepID=UPI00358F8E77
MANIMLGKAAENKPSLVLLSNDTIRCRIDDMIDDILAQVVADLVASPTKFSLQLDETTDVSNLRQPNLFVRYVKGDEIKEDFLFCKPLTTTTNAADVKKLVDDFFRSNGLSWNMVTKVTNNNNNHNNGKPKRLPDARTSQLRRDDVMSRICLYMSGEGYRGVTADEDKRFSNKQKKLMKETKFAEGLEKKVDMSKVNLETIKPWITRKITQMLSFEDDIVIEFVFNQLDEKQHPDGRLMQINLTGLLTGKNARLFMGELWPRLLSAQKNTDGIPLVVMEQIMEGIKQHPEKEERKKKKKRQLGQEKLALLQSKEEEEDRKAKERFSSRKRSFSRSRSRSRSRSCSRGRHRKSSSHSPQTSPPPVPPPSNELPPVDHSEKSDFSIGSPALTLPGTYMLNISNMLNMAVGRYLVGTGHQSPPLIPDQSAKPQSESPLPEVTSTTSDIVKVDIHTGGPVGVVQSKEVVQPEKSKEKDRKKPRHHCHSHFHTCSRSLRRHHRSRSRSHSQRHGSPRRQRVSPRHCSPPHYHSGHRRSPRRYRRPISHGRSHRRRRSRSPSHSPSSSRSPRRHQEKRRYISASRSVSRKELMKVESSSSSSKEDEEVKPRTPKNIARSERPHVCQRSQSHLPSPRHHPQPKGANSPCAVPKESLQAFQNFLLLLPHSLELKCVKTDLFHLYLHIVTHNFYKGKNNFSEFQNIN